MTPNVVEALDSFRLRQYAAETLACDISELSAMARARLEHPTFFRVAVGRVGPLPAAVNPQRSLLELGSDWQVAPSSARELLAQILVSEVLGSSGLRVSSCQPSVRAADTFVAEEPLFVVQKDSVWASSGLSHELHRVERVVALSEGYPPGVIAVHDGNPWSPGRVTMFSLSAFDGETFVWWR